MPAACAYANLPSSISLAHDTVKSSDFHGALFAFRGPRMNIRLSRHELALAGLAVTSRHTTYLDTAIKTMVRLVRWL